MNDDLLKELNKRFADTSNYVFDPSQFPRSVSAAETTAAKQMSEISDRYRKKHEQQERERRKTQVFKEAYIKVRTENIVLDHETALVLVREIFKQADMITFDDLHE